MTRIDNVLLHAALYMGVLRLAYDLSMLIKGIPLRWRLHKLYRRHAREYRELEASLSK